MKLFSWLLSNKPSKPKRVRETVKCARCGDKLRVMSCWTRGWNEWCNQAYGDKGGYCDNCQEVTFVDSLETHLTKKPDWCTPYR